MDLVLGLADVLGHSDNYSSQSDNYTCLDALSQAEPPYPTPGSMLAPVAAVAWWVLFVLILLPPFAASIIAFVTWLTVSMPNILFDRKGTYPRRLPSSVWTIHGQKYDLSSWISQHPGGPWAINLGRNRDCTGLFESYHTFIDRETLFKTLKPFEILQEAPPATTPQAPLQPVKASLGENSTGLEFGDAFHEDIKKMLREHFKGKSHKMKPLVACFFIACLLLHLLTGYMFLMGSNAALLILPFIAWLVGSTIAHDASHFAVSDRPWVNWLASCVGMPFISSPTCWSLQHVVQHHVYTNDGSHDVDLYHFMPFVRTSKETSWESGHFFWQWLSVFIFIPTTVQHLMFVVPMDLLSGHKDLITERMRYAQCQNIADFVARSRGTIWCEFAFCLSWFLLNLYMQGPYKGMMRMCTLYALESWIFIIFTQGAHLHGACFHSTEKSADKSWAKRQVATAINFAPGSFFWQTLTGGLNMQSLHHVAPIIGSSHFSDLYPKYKKVCEKHGVEVKEVHGIVEFARGFFGWIQELSNQDPLKEG